MTVKGKIVEPPIGDVAGKIRLVEYTVGSVISAPLTIWMSTDKLAALPGKEIVAVKENCTRMIPPGLMHCSPTCPNSVGVVGVEMLIDC